MKTLRAGLESAGVISGLVGARSQGSLQRVCGLVTLFKNSTGGDALCDLRSVEHVAAHATHTYRIHREKENLVTLEPVRHLLFTHTLHCPAV